MTFPVELSQIFVVETALRIRVFHRKGRKFCIADSDKLWIIRKLSTCTIRKLKNKKMHVLSKKIFHFKDCLFFFIFFSKRYGPRKSKKSTLWNTTQNVEFYSVPSKGKHVIILCNSFISDLSVGFQNLRIPRFFLFSFEIS